MDTVSNESTGGDEITERIGMDNAKSFTNLKDILERLKMIASVERTLFEDILGETVLPVPAAEIAPPSEK
jgi:hypothetical protein